MFRRGLSSSSPSTLHLSSHTKGHELPPYVCGNWTFQDRKQKMAWVLLWWISPGRRVTRSSKTVASILWREKDLHTGTLSPQLSPVCLSACLSVCLSVCLSACLSVCLSVSTLTKALAALSWSESMSCATLIVLLLLGFCLSLVIFKGYRMKMPGNKAIALQLQWPGYGLTLVYRLYHQISWVWNQWWLGWGPMFYQNALPRMIKMYHLSPSLALWGGGLPYCQGSLCGIHL